MPNSHRMSIYTKKGDSGSTSLANGTVVSKQSKEVRMLGEIDELMSFVGMAVSNKTCPKNTAEALKKIQTDLYKIGSFVGGTPSICVNDDDISLLESWIDELVSDHKFDFVKPGEKGELSAIIHVCRSVCRRCERSFAEYKENPIILKYLNRLSDLLFALAEC